MSSNNFSAPTEVKCFKTHAAKGKFESSTITRRALQPDDIAISIKYVGICHSDIHHAQGEWSSTIFPLVPGHEIVGEVVAVGSNVKTFQVGERAGVGCMVDSCRSCNNCSHGEEQYCTSGAIMTYNSRQKYPHCAEYNAEGGSITQGGYSQFILVDHRYALHVPEKLPFHATAPLLCAGITMYSPMKHFGLQKHHKFGVLGLGGLGHMGVKFGVAMGCYTAVISRGVSKKESALTDLKATAFIDSTNPEEMKANAGKFDLIICTVSANIDVVPVLQLLSTNGKLVFVGVAPAPIPIPAFSLIMRRQSVAGSLIGGIKETQEMLDFCGEHGITSDVEVVKGENIDEAYERTLRSDVKYRFVIDIAGSKF